MDSTAEYSMCLLKRSILHYIISIEKWSIAQYSGHYCTAKDFFIERWSIVEYSGYYRIVFLSENNGDHRHL